MMKAFLLAAMVGMGLLVLAASAAVAAEPPPPPPAMPTAPAPLQVQAPGGPQAARPGAVVLSLVMPGTGEWLNRDFEDNFPIGECCAGLVCPFVTLCSMLDAAAGDRSDRVRINFWAKPVPEK